MPVDGRQELSNGTEIQPAIGSCVPNCIGFGRCPFLFLLSMEFRVVEMNGEIIVQAMTSAPSTRQAQSAANSQTSHRNPGPRVACPG